MSHPTGGSSAGEAQVRTGEPLVSEFADDPDMLELVEMFVEELPQRIEAVRCALDKADFAELARLAHQLKGAGGGYGFPTITEAGAIVEHRAKAKAAGHDEQSADLEQAVEQMADLCRRATASGG